MVLCSKLHCQKVLRQGLFFYKVLQKAFGTIQLLSLGALSRSQDDRFVPHILRIRNESVILRANFNKSSVTAIIPEKALERMELLSLEV